MNGQGLSVLDLSLNVAIMQSDVSAVAKRGNAWQTRTQSMQNDERGCAKACVSVMQGRFEGKRKGGSEERVVEIESGRLNV